jgi:hypothetical protein
LGKHVYPQQFGDDSLSPPVFCLLRTAHNCHQNHHHHSHQNDNHHQNNNTNNAATAAMTITNASTSIANGATAITTMTVLPLHLFSPPTEYVGLFA